MRKAIKGLYRLCEGINRVVGWITVAFFIIMFGSCIIQVFTRYVLNNSLTWTDELARYTFMWSHMLGATVCSWTGSHAILSFVVERFPKKVQTLFQILAHGIVLAVGIVLLVYGADLLATASRQTSPALHLSMTYIYISVQVCAVLFILYSLVHMLDLGVNRLTESPQDVTGRERHGNNKEKEEA